VRGHADAADRLVHRVFEFAPFEATELGFREYDALMPDASVEAEQRMIDDVRALEDEARTLTPQSDDERVTLAVTSAWCDRLRRDLSTAPIEHTTGAMPIGASGPPMLMANLARLVLQDAQAADDYLARVRDAPRWVDQVTARLQSGAKRGRVPVSALLENAIAWADRTLAQPVPTAVMSQQPPQGWDGSSEWRDQLEQTVRDDLVPALGRWRTQLIALRASARPDEQAGIGHIPDGESDYRDAIEVHTTLPFEPRELHEIGLEAVQQLEERARLLGESIGLTDLDAIRVAMRASTSAQTPEESMAAARDAVRRAEAVAPELMPAPLPDACVVTPMPPTVAEAGMAPHYTPPRTDGSRPGTYWFNTVRATAGTGWDLEATAFHETVPGHHSQLARVQLLPELPLLQQLPFTTHAEGWGLYAERLAGEYGLYSSTEAEIGAVYVEMFRAARLVVDTGLHAFGWSRQRATDWFMEHVALAEGFLHNEIDRYIAWPGQALAYMVGQREILRLRDEARATTGARFSIPAFNAAVLDSGSLPMPVLADVVRRWSESASS
jgi:uncharacterized protein (DUF885 family)